MCRVPVCVGVSSKSFIKANKRKQKKVHERLLHLDAWKATNPRHQFGVTNFLYATFTRDLGGANQYFARLLFTLIIEKEKLCCI